jgi:hypothetical protein
VNVFALVSHRLKASTPLSAGSPGTAHGDAIAGFLAPQRPPHRGQRSRCVVLGTRLPVLYQDEYRGRT